MLQNLKSDEAQPDATSGSCLTMGLLFHAQNYYNIM